MSQQSGDFGSIMTTQEVPFAKIGGGVGVALGLGYAIETKSGFWKGFGFALIGGLASSGLGYGIGKLIKKKSTPFTVEKFHKDWATKQEEVISKSNQIDDILKNLKFPFTHLISEPTKVQITQSNPPWGTYVQDIKTLPKGSIVEIVKASKSHVGSGGFLNYGMGDPLVQLELKDGSYISINVTKLNTKPNGEQIVDSVVEVDSILNSPTEEKIKKLQQEEKIDNAIKYLKDNKREMVLYIGIATTVVVGGVLAYQQLKK